MTFHQTVHIMARARRENVVNILRQRVVRALTTGALAAGDRVPSTREMALQLDADPRVIADAYGELEAEGLIERRARSGFYVRHDAPAQRRAVEPPLSLIVDLLVEAGVRCCPAPVIVRALNAAVTMRSLRVAVITTTADQGLGIARELREDFGLDASAILVDRLKGDTVPDAVRRAQLLVTTSAHGALVASIGARFARPHVVVTIRRDLFEHEWSMWNGKPIHVIVLDPRFRTMVQQYLRASGADPQAIAVHLATANLASIGNDDPTYVTQAARAHLGRTGIPGIPIPPTRLLHEDCARAVWRVVAELNLKAAARQEPAQ